MASAEGEMGGLTDPDAVPPLPEKPVTVPGDLWILWRHRVLFGKKPLVKVDRQTVKDLLKDILAIRSVKTVELIHRVVSGIFSEAIDNGLFDENPAHGLTRKMLPPKRKRSESAPDPFSKEDLDAVLEAAKKHLETRVAMVIETLAMSGMRLGECLAAHRDYLDASI